MRTAIWVLTLAAIAAAEIADEPWVEEEDLEEPYSNNREYDHDRRKREAYVEGPFEEHVRVKRGCNDEPKYRVRRSADHLRKPRQVHQYEVHEFNDEASFPSPPYEEMLAASAEHYHRVYTPAPQARSLNRKVSAGPLTFGVPRAYEPVQVVAAPDLGPLPVSKIAHPNPNRNQADSLASVSLPNAEPVAFVPLSSEPLRVADDLSTAAGHHKEKQHPKSRGHSRGGGHQQHGIHNAEHGEKSTKKSNSEHHLDKGAKGFKTDELHRKEYEEAGGQKKKHHDRAGHKGDHEEEAFGSRGAHFGEKKGHKKGHKTKGFHNKYHKDEFHKEHKFYDDFHKGGEHHRYGKFNAKHASNESGKKKVHHVNAGHDFLEHGKKGYSNKGHLDADHKGHKGKSGHEEHNQHHAQHGKKGGKEGGSHWGYGN
ncbi:uncharacterized protein LOC125077822 [Vanessa atalanta]|uniref:uncharacterized protein LOC125077822 n=1 Tax=Vanessa atalanta TaxID=42275 RepID=UPI001FCD1C85|nr:uncharacterized protein LOC125077822 [Vanessa atalanta]